MVHHNKTFNFLEDDFLILLGPIPKAHKISSDYNDENHDVFVHKWWYMDRQTFSERLFLLYPVENVDQLCLECAALNDGIEILLDAERYLREGAWVAAFLDPSKTSSLTLYWANFYPVFRHAELGAAQVTSWTAWWYKDHPLPPTIYAGRVTGIDASFREDHKEEYGRFYTAKEKEEFKRKLRDVGYTDRWNRFFDKLHKIIN